MAHRSKEEDYSLENVCLDFKARHKINDSLVNEAMKRSVITKGFEANKQLPNNCMARPLAIKEKRGAKGLPEEVSMSVEIIRMRSALDPKRFYKKDKTISTSNNIQMGRIIDSPADFYHSRLPKKQRKGNLVDELLADAEFTAYNKKKFREIMISRANTKKKRYRHPSKNKTKQKANNK